MIETVNFEARVESRVTLIEVIIYIDKIILFSKRSLYKIKRISLYLFLSRKI